MGEDDQRTAYLGLELDQESQLGDHGVRKMDYVLGRFTTIDPLWEEFYSWSPYQYSYNNPVSFVDTRGDSAFVFNSEGLYQSSIDDGNDTWSIQVQHFSKTASGATLQFNQNISFNDIESDPDRMKATLNQKDANGNYVNRNNKLLYFSDDLKVEGFLARAGATEEIFLNTKYALNNSGGGGYMDFASKVMRGPRNSGFTEASTEMPLDLITPFFIIGGNAYNQFDYGNYIWGAAMNRIGHPLWYSKLGAHFHHLTREYLKNNSSSPLDSPWDQKAIEAGWNSQE